MGTISVPAEKGEPMDVKEKLFQMIEESRVTRSEHGIVINGTRFIAQYLVDHGVTITPAVPGPEVDHNITELCFNNGKEEGRKELKSEILAHLMEQKTKVKGLCHAHVVELMQFVEGL